MVARQPEPPGSQSQRPVPNSILIIGAGVFGLSTLHTLLTSPRYTHTTIIFLDSYLPSLTPSASTPPQPGATTPRNENENENPESTKPARNNRQPTQNPHSPRPTQLIQNPNAASIDSSRIIRADYANPAYARLATLAQQRWRAGFGGGGVYRESGIVLTAGREGSEYVKRAERNSRKLGGRVMGLRGAGDIRRVLGLGDGGGEGEGDGDRGKGRGCRGDGGGGVGEMGYVNWSSGWADNGAAMRWVMDNAVALARERNGRAGCGSGVGKVVFLRGTAKTLVYESLVEAGNGNGNGRGSGKSKVTGAVLENGQQICADLTVLAAGAWSGSLLDLRGRAEATGQVMAYFPLSAAEAERLASLPVLLNLTSGLFVIPPVYDTDTGGWMLKIARHAYGYTNPTTVRVGPDGGKDVSTSLPASTFSPIPADGEKALREFLARAIPWLSARPFCRTRICWYTDTPSGDFLIDHHDEVKGLFLATGGSGHGFKFLPVIGGRIVDAIEGRLEDELRDLWRWREGVPGAFGGTEDGSRGGRPGMRLEDEWAKGRSGWSKL